MKNSDQQRGDKISEQLFNLDLWTALMDLLPTVLIIQTSFFMIDQILDAFKIVKKIWKKKKGAKNVAR